MRHAKLRNTGLLFELLTRQVASDALSGKDTKVVDIIKEYFYKTELGKELELYRYLAEENFNNSKTAIEFVEQISKLKSKLDNNKLKKEKYNLVKELKTVYGLESFFKTKVERYKLFASSYKLLEYNGSINIDPAEYVRAKQMITEHLIREKVSDSDVEKSMILEQDKEMRPIIIKIMTDKYNKKYSVLNENQKKLLRHYVNNAANPDKFKEYFIKEVVDVKKQIINLSKNITEKVIKIKVNEVYNLLDEKKIKSSISEDRILRLMRYYEMIEELKNLEGK